MNTRRRVMVSTLAIIVVASACAGESTTAPSSTDEVEIVMRDSVFDPRSIEVDEGEEITFRFVNRGSLPHDAFIGDEEAQGDHEEMMRAAEADEHDAHGGGDEGITVEPGKSGTITYRFDERGEVLIGCHQPGHYAGGMVVRITVG